MYVCWFTGSSWGEIYSSFGGEEASRMPTSSDKSYASYESFGKYRLLAEIGRGGMSEIYLTVTQGGLGGFQKLVVLKLLRQDLAQDDEFRRMFLDEARLAA